MKKYIFAAGTVAGLMLTSAISSSHAASFTVNNGTTETVSQTLSADGETGAVYSGSTLSTNMSPAINAGGLNQYIYNAGTIETTNAGNAAIVFGGGASTGTSIANMGTIRTTGGGAAHAIQITPSSPGITIKNSGTISASGTGNAVRFFADDNKLANSGTITTAGSDAIFVSGNNNSIVLSPGTKLTGGINFAAGSGNVLEYYTGKSCPAQGGLCTIGLSTAPTITGGTLGVEYTQVVHNLGTGTPHNGVETANGAVVTLPTLMAVKTQKIIGLLGAVTAEMAESMGSSPAVSANSEKVTSGISGGDPYAPAGQWMLEAYGSYRERPEHGKQSYSESRSGGIIGGYMFPQTDDGLHVGLYASAFADKTDMGKVKFRTIDSEGGLIGAMAKKSVGAFDVTGNLIAGFASNDSDRIVGGGGGVARADYNNYFISPRVTVARPFVQESGYVWTPSVMAGYVYGHADSFTETGSLANQSVDSTNSHALMSRAQVELALPHHKMANGGVFKTSFRTGLEGMTEIGNDSIGVRVLGDSVSITPDTERSLDAIIGLNLNLDVSEAMQLYVDGEAAIGLNNGGTSDNKGGTARVGFKWSF